MILSAFPSFLSSNDEGMKTSVASYFICKNEKLARKGVKCECERTEGV